MVEYQQVSHISEGKRMSEKIVSFRISEIEAINFVCEECGSVISQPMARASEEIRSCPSCNQVWNSALASASTLINAIRRFENLGPVGMSVRLVLKEEL